MIEVTLHSHVRYNEICPHVLRTPPVILHGVVCPEEKRRQKISGRSVMQSNPVQGYLAHKKTPAPLGLP